MREASIYSYWLINRLVLVAYVDVIDLQTLF